ncbi:5-bromo-4-chloroindolyl phosphate hydrolysis family protein [Roseovarius aestuariivivens]|uniref:5-bromo-4-chloroindolyl phosphate hydrolysis family protein n=1 Tax=Roseovarius aestuariivivens TaxID=1888910 RepID=UPI0010813D29|nr:5-bromo-4-chloroindolyl phosphate hydrolysis family protein [Roseovarius aestuariivivens]
MARRYGGKYSPEGGGPEQSPVARGTFHGARRTRAGGRVNLLFLAPLPLVWQAFSSGPTGLILNLLALGMLLLAAWLTREGILAQEAYEARKVARAPGIPRKLFGSVLTGLGLGLAGFAASDGIVAPLIYAVVGAVLHSFAFGLDPMKDKGMEGIDKMQTDRVARVVDQAETYLSAMTDAIKRAGDRQAEARLERFQLSVRDMLRTVEDDPRDLTAARKYLGVYLMGARDATVKFADIYARSRDADARSDYMMLLTDLEENFVAKTRKLLEDNNTDLEVEIGVLRDRLEREGVRLGDTP